MAYLGRGLGAIKEAAENSLQLLKLKGGESRQIRIVVSDDDIISVYEHTEQLGGQWKTITCLGKSECPLCQAGLQASYRSYIPVLDREDGRVKIFKASKRVGVQLLGLQEEYGPLNSRDYKVLRNGERLETTYQFFPKDPSELDDSGLEIPNIEEIVKPMSPEDIMALMDGGFSVVEPNKEGNANDDSGFPF